MNMNMLEPKNKTYCHTYFPNIAPWTSIEFKTNIGDSTIRVAINSLATQKVFFTKVEDSLV